MIPTLVGAVEKLGAAEPHGGIEEGLRRCAVFICQRPEMYHPEVYQR
jgi:hypothetical protein